ncbi:hypothetical protein STEG23_010897 [Scotinomys teguina]
MSMFGSAGYLCFPDELSTSSLSLDRKDKKNHTNKLRELALLIPVTTESRDKKYTKKEILLRVLHYIQYLQRSIDVAKALLQLHNNRGGFVGLGWNPPAGPTWWRNATRSSSQKSHLWGTCSRPRKKFTQVSECPTWPQKPENLVTEHPGQREANGKGATYPRDLSPGTHPTTTLSLLEDDGGEAQLVFLDMDQDIVVHDITSDHDAETQDGEPDIDIEAQSRAQSPYFLTRAQPCLSEADKEAPDTDPWLPAWTSEDSPNGSPMALESSRTSTWHVTNPSETLVLSSSLFNSPSKILPAHVLEDSTYCLTEGLMESSDAVCELEDPQETDIPSEDSTGPPNFESSVSLDHCYLPLNENIQVLSSCSSSSESTDTESPWGQEQANHEGLQISSDEDRDHTWTPTQWFSGLLVANKKTKKPKESRKARHGQTRKKCVNGFIMFCRMNRKLYIRWSLSWDCIHSCHQGAGSTVAKNDSGGKETILVGALLG